VRVFAGRWAVIALVIVAGAGCAGSDPGLLEQGVHAGADGEAVSIDLSTDATETTVAPSDPDAPSLCDGWQTLTQVPALVLEVPGAMERGTQPIDGTPYEYDTWMLARATEGYSVASYPLMFGDPRTPQQRAQEVAEGVAGGDGSTIVASTPGDWLGAPLQDVESLVTRDDGTEWSQFVRAIDLPDARTLMISSIGARIDRDATAAAHARIVGSLASADPAAVPAVVCELEPLGDPTPFADIDGITLSTPGRTVPHQLPLDGDAFRYWTAGQDGLTVRVGAWTILEGDERSVDERLADFAVLFTGDDGVVVTSATTEWKGAPAVDIEVSFDAGSSFVLSRVIELPDGRVLLLQTDGYDGTRAAVTAAHEDLIASLALAG
jgi:hypothetical protein